MASLGVHVDPAPQGKTIGKIHVVNQDVFSKRDWYFQLFNIFHWTTRDYILERELLLRPGQAYDQALVEESTRNLQSPAGIVVGGKTVAQPELSSVVVLLPVASAVPGQVDLLLVTRDIWSLRFNTTFEYQGERADVVPDVAVGEQPVRLAQVPVARLQLRPGEVLLRPDLPGSQHPRHAPDAVRAGAVLQLARDRRLRGQQPDRVGALPALFAGQHAGARASTSPTSNNVVRVFQGNSLRLVDLSGTPEIERFPYEYGRRVVVVDANAVRSFRGAAVIQRVTVGYLADSAVAEVLPTFPGDAAAAALFLSEWAPIPSSARSRTCATSCSRPATWCCAISTPSTCARTASSVRCFARGSPKGCPRWAPASPRSASAWRPASRPRRREAMCPSRPPRRAGGGTTNRAGSISWAPPTSPRRRRSWAGYSGS